MLSAAMRRPVDGDSDFNRIAGQRGILRSVTARQLWEEGGSGGGSGGHPRVVGTGVSALDGLLRGGFPCGSISEVCGEAGAGKTQLLLQMLIRVQMPLSDKGHLRKSVYICTEGDLPITRLSALAEATAHRRPDLFSSADGVLANIYIERASTPEEVQAVISDRLPNLMGCGYAEFCVNLQTPRAALDSIAAPIRYESGFSAKEDSGRRADLLLRIGAMLKTLCYVHACPCVVSNQVVDLVSDGLFQPSAKIPALGLAWAHAVNTRLFLFRAPHAQDREGSELGEGPGGVREMRLVWSPWAAEGSCLLRITPEGLQDAVEGE